MLRLILIAKGTYADGFAKEADNSFRPEKPEVAYPNGIDKKVSCVFSIEPLKSWRFHIILFYF